MNFSGDDHSDFPWGAWADRNYYLLPGRKLFATSIFETRRSKEKKKKKGISVKKFPVFKHIEGAVPSKFLKTKQLFAESRQIRGYGNNSHIPQP
jgi:hypothetical protein